MLNYQFTDVVFIPFTRLLIKELIKTGPNTELLSTQLATCPNMEHCC